MDFISQIIDEVVESVVEERWLPIVGYENYEVSDLGRVKSLARNGTKGGILKYAINQGYLRVCLSKNNKNKNVVIHRLVLQAFQPTEEDLECDHINHIKSDNRLCNLRWATKSQNVRFQKKREGCSSQYRGVINTYRKTPWRASCRLNGKIIHIGTFDDEHDAGRAYNDFIIKHNLQHFTILNDITQ
jgi:hypothetical protein